MQQTLPLEDSSYLRFKWDCSAYDCCISEYLHGIEQSYHVLIHHSWVLCIILINLLIIHSISYKFSMFFITYELRLRTSTRCAFRRNARHVFELFSGLPSQYRSLRCWWLLISPLGSLTKSRY
jgi:hypothetical protein